MGLSKAAHMERVESTALAGAQGPCFAVIKQSAEHTGFINVHLDVRCQHSVVPHPVGPAIAVADLTIFLSSSVSRTRLLDTVDRR